MDARLELAELLGHWLRLTQAEAKAILSAAWPSVREIQAAKGRLRKPIAELKEAWQAENSGEWLSAPGMESFRREAGRLVSLETRNGELLASQLQRARRERESLDQALRNLRNVHRFRDVCCRRNRRRRLELLFLVLPRRHHRAWILELSSLEQFLILAWLL